jgi:hypothetical protein
MGIQGAGFRRGQPGGGEKQNPAGAGFACGRITFGLTSPPTSIAARRRNRDPPAVGLPGAGADQHGRRPLPGADQVLQLGALVSGQTDNLFGQRHGQIPGRGYPSKKTHALLEVNSGRVEQ